MKNLKLCAILAAVSVLALSPDQAAAEVAPKPISLGVKIQMGEKGPEIVEMLPDRTAAAIGFKVGDILLEAGGEPISQEILLDYLKKAKSGDRVRFKVMRGGTEMDLAGTALPTPEGAPPPPPPQAEE